MKLQLSFKYYNLPDKESKRVPKENKNWTNKIPKEAVAPASNLVEDKELKYKEFFYFHLLQWTQFSNLFLLRKVVVCLDT